MYLLDIALFHSRDSAKKCFEKGCWNPEVNLKRLKNAGYPQIPSNTEDMLDYYFKYTNDIVELIPGEKSKVF